MLIGLLAPTGGVFFCDLVTDHFSYIRGYPNLRSPKYKAGSS